MKRIHAIIHGKVQGVFFRATARDKARALELKGFVRNLPDGSVEIEAQGETALIEVFLRWCHNGPPQARVEKVCVNWKPIEEDLLDFHIQG
ncbi:MAG: acylphosphatase [Bdellovibrionales bacterium]|nr:acylphosphatase [Bdellovibrionales bacterium]